MNTMINPIVTGWYADPEARFYEGKYWIYVTRSHTDYKKQLNLDAFSSDDLIHWEKHESIIEMQDFPWIWRATWAPTIIEKNSKYFLMFASNDIQSDNEIGGLEIAVANHPSGPFRGIQEKSVIDRFINLAQPIDAHFFKDDDETIYLYYGGWQHCNVAKMNDEMTGFIPFENGETFQEITPIDYVEGPCMLKKDGQYYFMWSSGSWTDGSYCVDYSVSNSPLGPFERKGTILKAQKDIADGPGHHGYLHIQESDEWLIVYHRRIIGDSEAGHRILCIDKMEIGDGVISEIVMTHKW